MLWGYTHVLCICIHCDKSNFESSKAPIGYFTGWDKVSKLFFWSNQVLANNCFLLLISPSIQNLQVSQNLILKETNKIAAVIFLTFDLSLVGDRNLIFNVLRPITYKLFRIANWTTQTHIFWKHNLKVPIHYIKVSIVLPMSSLW